jgi:hypothetical protein
VDSDWLARCLSARSTQQAAETQTGRGLTLLCFA